MKKAALSEEAKVPLNSLSFVVLRDSCCWSIFGFPLQIMLVEDKQQLWLNAYHIDCQNQMRRLIVRLEKFFSSVPIPNAFTHLHSCYSDDMKVHLHQYQHQATKAHIYHFQNSDPENAFASVVKTFASNNKGCPHILEHLACCGSEKYPIRDPFFNMIKRSVNSYMNAWTGDDFTCYPFSSPNLKDWNNLYRVYLDMSLKPILHKLDFHQEGWRYQINQQGVKQFKGIVLNQMKGAYQNADRQLIKEINETLFRGTPYIYDTGGRPEEIVNLGYPQLKAMYDFYYHPSNMCFYFYGSKAISEQLSYLDQEYLSHYQDQSQRYNKEQIKPLPVLPEKQSQTISSKTAQTNTISINFYLGNLNQISPERILSLKMLSYILLEKTNAKVYQEFIEKEVAENIGFSGLNEAKLTTFSITLKGVEADYSNAIYQQAIMNIFSEIKQNGLEESRINQFLHQTEISILSARENNGIRLLEDFLTMMNHKVDMQAYLQTRKLLQRVKQMVQNKSTLQELIQTCFLNNRQFVIVKQVVERSEEQKAPAEEISSEIKIDDETIIKQQEELQARQRSEQNAEVLPSLELADLANAFGKEYVPVQEVQANGKTVKYYKIPIEGEVNFYRIVFSFEAVDQAFLQKLHLWIFTFNQGISTSTYNYKQLSSLLANHTHSFQVSTSALNSNKSSCGLNVMFEFACLKKNRDRSFELFEQMLMSPKFEKDNVLNIYRAYSNELTEILTESPMNECRDEGASSLSLKASIMNTYQREKEALQLAKAKNIEILYEVSHWMTKCSNIKLIEHTNSSLESLPSFVQNLLAQPASFMKSASFIPSFVSKAVTNNFNVNFCSQHYIGPERLSFEQSHLRIALECLEQDYLHPEIREKGGAYGARATINQSQIISLYSYMDPQSLVTFDVFDQSVKKFMEKDYIDEKKLVETKIKIIGHLDRPKTPQDQGVSQIVNGDNVIQFRKYLLDSSSQQVVDRSRIYLSQRKSRCIFGKDALQGFLHEPMDFLTKSD